MTTDFHDPAVGFVHDGDPAHRIGTRALRRRLDPSPELDPSQRAVLRLVGDPVYGTCPVCGSRDVELVVRNGRESCRSCPWEVSPPAPEIARDELASILEVSPDRVEAVLLAAADA